ncbi:diguanylate cyclase [Aurantimonas sp. Leaf443]|nr:diguanylate cyclase [Aurantimonas sp. Leaf443]
MSQGLCMFDAEEQLVVCNHRYHELFGLPAGSLSFGMTQTEVCRVLLRNGCYPAGVTLDQLRLGTLTALGGETGQPVLRELADGRVLSILYRSMDGGGWVSTFEDVTAQRRSEARIAHLARHDGLTDLLNSRTFREGDHALLRPADPKRPVVALLSLDLDRFKFVNDTYGHALGDELLRAVAERLRMGVRPGSAIARMGGDEFAILMRARSEAEVMARAQALVAAIARPFETSGGFVEIGVSIGLETVRGGLGDIERLILDADLALRHAKASGRGQVRVFDPAMSESARLRRALESDLHEALATDAFELHYQPLVELAGDRIVGMEALVRWNHPERGLVSPATFIPVAEEIGLIVSLGEWVLRRACADASHWPDEIAVAVNVSSMQLQQAGFAQTVFETLAQTGLAAARLEIEITESAILDESEATARNIAALKAAGIRFAMDDFGTGYSSLSYLRRFPIDKIKIDRSFMKDAETSADALAIIRAVAGLGVSLGITTLVEGVETAEQLDLARAEGLSQVQGYLISRPKPRAEIEGMLRAAAAPSPAAHRETPAGA